MAKIDPDSETWQAVDAWASELLMACRTELESPNIDDRTAQFLRGRINLLRGLRALPEPSLAARPEDSDAFFGI